MPSSCLENESCLKFCSRSVAKLDISCCFNLSPACYNFFLSHPGRREPTSPSHLPLRARPSRGATPDRNFTGPRIRRRLPQPPRRPASSRSDKQWWRIPAEVPPPHRPVGAATPLHLHGGIYPASPIKLLPVRNIAVRRRALCCLTARLPCGGGSCCAAARLRAPPQQQTSGPGPASAPVAHASAVVVQPVG